MWRHARRSSLGPLDAVVALRGRQRVAAVFSIRLLLLLFGFEGVERVIRVGCGVVFPCRVGDEVVLEARV